MYHSATGVHGCLIHFSRLALPLNVMFLASYFAFCFGQSHAALKDGDIPADVVVSLLEMSDALHKGSYSLQVGVATER